MRTHTHTPHPSKERALGRKLRDCLLYPETGIGKNTSNKFKASSLENPAFGGGGGQVSEWRRRGPEAQRPGSLFTPFLRTRLQTHKSGSLRPLHLDIPCPGAPGFLPARARPLLGAGGGGVAFPGGAASLAPGHSDSALTDRHQMLFRAALRSARRFRFSIDRRKPGKGESVDVTSPQPQARGWGPGRDGCQTVRIWSFANRGGWGNVTSPRVSLSAQQS